MLIDKEVNIKWNNATKKWYEDKGYKYTKKNDIFTINIKDMLQTSTIRVNVKCDYCGKEHTKEYRKYIRGRNIIEKDCCDSKKCLANKTKEINLKLYGVENCMQRTDIKEKVSNKMRTSFENVSKLCNEKGLILISKESDYKNDRSRLLVICTHHKDKYIQETNLANIKSSKYCCFYGGVDATGDSRRLDISIIKEKFIELNYEPKFKDEEYKNNQHKLPFICNKHRNKGVQYTQYGNLQQGEGGCKYCAIEERKKKLRLNEDYIFNKFKEKGLIVLEGEKYINKDTPIKYRCSKHPNIVQHSCYNNLKRVSQPCDICRNEESLTKLNRRLRSSIAKWRRDTEKFYNYKCFFTNSKEYDVHHIHPFNEILKEALSNLNLNIDETDGYNIKRIKDEVISLHKKYGLGICIHPDIHNLFHTEFGKDATIKDFEKFKKNYINGLYKRKLNI